MMVRRNFCAAIKKKAIKAFRADPPFSSFSPSNHPQLGPYFALHPFHCHTLASNTMSGALPPRLQLDLVPLCRARKRWRTVFTALNSTRVFQSLVAKKQNGLLVPLYGSRARKRWHTVFATLNITRVFQSLVAKKQNGLLGRKLRSLSYTVVDVKPDLFPIHPSSLSGLAERQNFNELSDQFGGVEGVLVALGTHRENGIQGNDDDIANRNKSFGSNMYWKPPARREVHLVLEALKDPICLILLLCAALSLVFGINKHGVKGWSDGASIFAAVFLLMAVTVMSNLWAKMQFDKLSKACNDVPVCVGRNGHQEHISLSNVVVGDVVRLRNGDQVPADGLFLDGHGRSLRACASSVTGESEPIVVDFCPDNRFLLAGTTVVDGQARMLVTSVGINTAWGKSMSRIGYDYTKKTPLQAELNKVKLFIAKVGLAAAFLVLLVLLIRYFTGHMHDDNSKRMFIRGRTSIHDVQNAVFGILATPVAIAAAAIPEGLLLAVTISLAYSTKQMVGDRALVRNLWKHEEVGAATVICTKKRGTLASHRMKVSEFWVGQKSIKGRNSSIAPNVLRLLHQAVGMSTDQAPLESLSQPFQKEAEEAIHNWCVQEMSMDMEGLRMSYGILPVKTFDPKKKWRGILIKRQADSTIHVHRKGAPEAILAMCSHYYNDGANIGVIDSRARVELEERIQIMASSGLCCIAFAHKQMSEEDYNNVESHLEREEEGLTFLGLVGLKHPCHDAVRQAVEEFRKAGVTIKMITGDDVSAARATAIECGIIRANEDITPGVVVEGMEFQNYTSEERWQRVDKILVMAGATPLNKLAMVQCLKEKGHVVAVTGDSTEDAAALREADIGISLGIQATDMAKKNSDIVILDDNFASVVGAWRWGRGMYNNIQMFTQFQLTVSIASLVIDIVAAISAAKLPTINIVAAISAGKVPYAALQLLWVKMIVGALAPLALTIEMPDEDIMEQEPVQRTQPFITAIMWRNILAQALYQIVVMLTIQFKGKSIFTVDAKAKDTFIFNTFVLCQIFLIFNARKLEKNIFKRLHKNKLFWVVIGATIVVQAVMVEFLKRFAETERLSWGQWGACVGIAALSWPFGWLVKCIPVHKNPCFTFLEGRSQL